MPQVTFTTDLASGRSETHIEGIAGPGCDQADAVLKALKGTPSEERRTREYGQRPEQRVREWDRQQEGRVRRV
jgi:hypothetical protein